MGRNKNKNSKNKALDKKMIVIIAACTLAAGILIGIFAMRLVKDSADKNGGQEQTASSETGETKDDKKETLEKADQLADGEVYDFEEAGYIKLGEYKGLKADVQPSEEDVYASMVVAADEAKMKKEGDDTVLDGDIVSVNFTGKLNGVKLEEASAEDAYIWIGKGEYIDDFERGIIGIQTGKKKTVDCTFPSDYDDEMLAGKTVQFTIKVNGKFSARAAEKISEGKYKTVQEYYDYEKAAQIEENRASKGELVWDEVRDNAEIKSVPKQMLERAKTDVTYMYTNFAELSGVEVDDLLAEFGMDEDGLDEVANDTVADVMVAKTIAAKEGVTMDDAFYDQALREALGYEESDEQPDTLEKLEADYKESTGSRPRDDMLIERVKDFVGENATE